MNGDVQELMENYGDGQIGLTIHLPSSVNTNRKEKKGLSIGQTMEQE